MIAAWTPSYGPAHLLETRVVPEPTLSSDQVLVDVHASPVTAGDLRLRTADFPGVSAVIGRLLFGMFAPRQKVQGTMFSGRVVAVGEQVSRFAVGDAVFGSVDTGAWAERVVVKADGPIAHRPANVDDDRAASVPYGAGTAVHFLQDLAKVQRGERVLILGGSGGVGRFAIQVAKHLGAHVTAVGSRESSKLMRQLGADEVLDYRTDDYTQSGRTYDVIFDIADVSSFAHSRAALAPDGRYLTLTISMRALFQMIRTRVVGGRRAIFSVAMGTKDSMQDLAEWMAAGLLEPVVAKRLALAQVAEAHALAEAGVHGSIVVRPAQSNAAVRVA